MLRHSNVKRSAARLAATVSAMAFASVAHAQSVQSPAAAPDQTVDAGQTEGATEDSDEIIVYAQRRAEGESVQRVPIAITAIDQSVLSDTRTVSLGDIGGLAPGARLSPLGTTAAFPGFFIRGLGLNSSTRSIDPAVNIIQDGMVVTFTAGSIPSLFDLESIEILRGPQGVLFGRNATGGAVVLRTRMPADHFQVLGDVSYGNFDEFNFNGSVEGPLGTPDIQGRLAVFYRSNSGTTLNTNNGTFVPAPANPTGARSNHATGYIGDLDELTIKPTIHFNISDGTELTLYTQYSSYDDDGQIGRARPAPAGLPLPLSQTQFGYTPVGGVYETNILDPGYVRLRAGHVIAEMTNEIGAGVLTTNVAYRDITFDNTANLSSGAPFIGLILENNEEANHQFSAESRYNVSLLDNLDLTAGVYYLDSVTSVVENRRIKQTAAAEVQFRGEFDQTTEAIAGFANLDWRIIDDLTLSLGGRYSSESKSIIWSPILPCLSGTYTNCPQNFSTNERRWNDFSPRAVLSWQVTPRALLYASYTEGFRSGNYNPRISSVAGVGLGPVEPEAVAAYEAGAKTEFFDRRLRFNLSVYQNDYDEIQQVAQLGGATGLPVQILLNVASGTIRGAEAELHALPTDWLTLDANLVYTDAQYTSFAGPIVNVTDPFALRFPRVPEWTSYIAGTLHDRIEQLDGELSLRVSYDWRSDFVMDFLNTRGLTHEAYGLTNANLQFERDNWSVGVYVRNMFDVYYADQLGFAFTYSESGGSPRLYGARATFKF